MKKGAIIDNRDATPIPRLEKVVEVGVIPKDLAALNTTANDMVGSTRGMDADSPLHHIPNPFYIR